MGHLLGLWVWLQENYLQMGEVLGLGLLLAEGIVKLTPTQADDGFVHRVGAWIDKIMALLRIPNIKKKVS